MVRGRTSQCKGQGRVGHGTGRSVESRRAQAREAHNKQASTRRRSQTRGRGGLTIGISRYKKGDGSCGPGTSDAMSDRESRHRFDFLRSVGRKCGCTSFAVWSCVRVASGAAAAVLMYVQKLPKGSWSSCRPRRGSCKCRCRKCSAPAGMQVDVQQAGQDTCGKETAGRRNANAPCGKTARF